uniref:Uncharacterized protein n=1 Tax=Anguilla anguilla TaxID=7936 RepID=A0A0E9UED9_ANGAN
MILEIKFFALNIEISITFCFNPCVSKRCDGQSEVLQGLGYVLAHDKWQLPTVGRSIVVQRC